MKANEDVGTTEEPLMGFILKSVHFMHLFILNDAMLVIVLLYLSSIGHSCAHSSAQMIFMLNVIYKEKYMHPYKVFYVFIFFPDYLGKIYYVQQWICT